MGTIVIALYVVVGTLLLLAILCILYLRRKNSRARHHSDLDFDDLGKLNQPLLEGNEQEGRRQSTAVEMVTKMWNSQDSKARIKHPWQIDYRKLCLGRRIGSGAFGMVFEGRYDGTMHPVAVKKLPLSLEEDSRKQEAKAAQSEMQILWELRHPVRRLNKLPRRMGRIDQIEYSLNMVNLFCEYSIHPPWYPLLTHFAPPDTASISSPPQHLLHFYGMAFVRIQQEEFMCLVTELCLCSLDTFIGSGKKRQEAVAKGLPEMSLEVLQKVGEGLPFFQAPAHALSVAPALTPASALTHADTRSLKTLTPTLSHFLAYPLPSSAT
jgi:hypothetical protein